MDRGDGRVAYDVAGSGPLVLMVPGMGDLRTTFRFQVPALAAAGFRVATTDLRGHGDSDTTFTSYGDVETAGDVIAIIDELGGPAVVVGNSMGAGAGVLAAAERPDLVAGLVLVGPFVRDGSVSRVSRAVMRIATLPPWVARTWQMLLPRLYAGQRPVDWDTYLPQVMASLRRPGYAKAFSRTTRTTHAPAQASLSDVRAPALVVMGERDPDFPDPQAEATWIASALDGEVVMVGEAGHYPHSQQPEETTAAILDFLNTVPPRA